jgi:hypothetical protein
MAEASLPTVMVLSLVAVVRSAGSVTTALTVDISSVILTGG